MFGNLNIPANDIAQEKDSLGSGFSLLDSGIYKATIEMAYGTQSKSGALGLVTKFIVRNGNKDVPFTHTFWITNKQGDVFYVDKDGNKQFLMGYNQVNAIAKGTVNKQVNQLQTQQRTLPIYSYEAKAEVPTPVQVFNELLGKEVALGILKTRENKQTSSNGEYVPTNDEVFRNNIDKVFIIKGEDILTLNEYEAGTGTEFALKWKEKWENQVQDKFKEVLGASSSKTTQPLDIG